MKKTILLVLVAVLFVQGASFACSSFRLSAKDGSVVFGRSMEFPIDIESSIWIVPRGTKYSITNNDGVAGLSWTSKYGVLGIDGYKVKNSFVDGFNEKGLSVSGLMFDSSIYQKVVPGKYIPFDMLGTWALGNFATVDEVKKALPNIIVTDTSVEKLKGMGFHFFIDDPGGKGIVVEYIDGKLRVFDNKVGVMTNCPDYNWQMNNLRNYINLNAHDIEPKTINGVEIIPTGVGSGMLGLPGDWSPPSRFIRLAIASSNALPAKNSIEAINLAKHLLNIVDIPKGVIKENPKPSVEIYGFAQWIIVKDLTNKVLYFKTYTNPVWRSVDLKKFSLKPGTHRKSMSIDNSILSVPDVSDKFKSQ
ncbi:MAG: choloylglycine hydrolase family protein [Candidatus Eremiobacteraeota bacterium]|nr:choloylglycine hydrolase family protein [Candidatus Eremiobacteraeota bacterium]